MKRVASIAFSLSLAIGSGSVPATQTQVEVFKSPYCGCCEKWVEYLKQNDFRVTVRETDNVPAQRKALGMPDQYSSCHTARVGAYVVEGHVPAPDLRKLLATKPKALGLAVPGMPQSSPGMDNDKSAPYDTLLVVRYGPTSVFARH